MFWMIFAVILIVSYLIGSVNAAVILSKLIAHKDVRDFGSGNAGMTNVMRVMGFLPGLLTFLFDSLKGAVVCALAKFLVFPYLYANLNFEFLKPEYAVFYCAILCLIGHTFPVFFGFKGGKGVATSLGILFVCQYQTAIIGFSLFLLVFIISRIISLSSITACFAVPFINIMFAKGDNTSVLIQCLLMGAAAGFVIFMHRANIVRLIKGEEKKLIVNKKGTK